MPQLKVDSLGFPTGPTTDTIQNYNPTGGSVRDFSHITDLDSLKKQGVEEITTDNPNQLQRSLVASQGGWEKFGKQLVNTIPNIALSIAETAGYFHEAMGYIAADLSGTLKKEEIDFTNGLTEWAQRHKNPVFDVHFEQPEGVADSLSSGDWWIQNGLGLAESVTSFFATGAGVGTVLNKSLSLGAKTLARSVKAVTRLNPGSALEHAAARVAQASTASSLAYAEGAMSGATVFKEVYEANKDALGDKAAKEKAADAAMTTVAINTLVNSALNLTSVAGMFSTPQRALKREVTEAIKGKKSLQEIKDYLSKFDGEAYAAKKHTRAGNIASTVSESVQESAEEFVNVFSERRGRVEGELLAEESVWDSLKETLKSDEGILAMILGAAGGAGQKLLMGTLKRGEDGKITTNLNSQRQELKAFAERYIDETKVLFDKTANTLAEIREASERVSKYDQNEFDEKIEDERELLNTLTRKLLIGPVAEAARANRLDGLKAFYENIKAADHTPLSETDSTTYNSLENQISNIVAEQQKIVDSRQELTREERANLPEIKELEKQRQGVIEQMSYMETNSKASELGIPANINHKKIVGEALDVINEYEELYETSYDHNDFIKRVEEYELKRYEKEQETFIIEKLKEEKDKASTPEQKEKIEEQEKKEIDKLREETQKKIDELQQKLRKEKYQQDVLDEKNKGDKGRQNSQESTIEEVPVDPDTGYSFDSPESYQHSDPEELEKIEQEFADLLPDFNEPDSSSDEEFDKVIVNQPTKENPYIITGVAKIYVEEGSSSGEQILHINYEKDYKKSVTSFENEEKVVEGALYVIGQSKSDVKSIKSNRKNSLIRALRNINNNKRNEKELTNALNILTLELEIPSYESNDASESSIDVEYYKQLLRGEAEPFPPKKLSKNVWDNVIDESDPLVKAAKHYKELVKNNKPEEQDVIERLSPGEVHIVRDPSNPDYQAAERLDKNLEGDNLILKTFMNFDGPVRVTTQRQGHISSETMSFQEFFKMYQDGEYTYQEFLDHVPIQVFNKDNELLGWIPSSRYVAFGVGEANNLDVESRRALREAAINTGELEVVIVKKKGGNPLVDQVDAVTRTIADANPEFFIMREDDNGALYFWGEKNVSMDIDHPSLIEVEEGKQSIGKRAGKGVIYIRVPVITNNEDGSLEEYFIMKPVNQLKLSETEAGRNIAKSVRDLLVDYLKGEETKVEMDKLSHFLTPHTIRPIHVEGAISMMEEYGVDTKNVYDEDGNIIREKIPLRFVVLAFLHDTNSPFRDKSRRHNYPFFTIMGDKLVYSQGVQGNLPDMAQIHVFDRGELDKISAPLLEVMLSDIENSYQNIRNFDSQKEIIHELMEAYPQEGFELAEDYNPLLDATRTSLRPQRNDDGTYNWTFNTQIIIEEKNKQKEEKTPWWKKIEKEEGEVKGFDLDEFDDDEFETRYNYYEPADTVQIEMFENILDNINPDGTLAPNVVLNLATDGTAFVSQEVLARKDDEETLFLSRKVDEFIQNRKTRAVSQISEARVTIENARRRNHRNLAKIEAKMNKRISLLEKIRDMNAHDEQYLRDSIYIGLRSIDFFREKELAVIEDQSLEERANWNDTNDIELDHLDATSQKLKVLFSNLKKRGNNGKIYKNEWHEEEYMTYRRAYDMVKGLLADVPPNWSLMKKKLKQLAGTKDKPNGDMYFLQDVIDKIENGLVLNGKVIVPPMRNEFVHYVHSHRVHMATYLISKSNGHLVYTSVDHNNETIGGRVRREQRNNIMSSSMVDENGELEQNLNLLGQLLGNRNEDNSYKNNGLLSKGITRKEFNNLFSQTGITISVGHWNAMLDALVGRELTKEERAEGKYKLTKFISKPIATTMQHWDIGRIMVHGLYHGINVNDIISGNGALATAFRNNYLQRVEKFLPVENKYNSSTRIANKNVSPYSISKSTFDTLQKIKTDSTYRDNLLKTWFSKGSFWLKKMKSTALDRFTLQYLSLENYKENEHLESGGREIRKLGDRSHEWNKIIHFFDQELVKDGPDVVTFAKMIFPTMSDKKVNYVVNAPKADVSLNGDGTISRETLENFYEDLIKPELERVRNTDSSKGYVADIVYMFPFVNNLIWKKENDVFSLKRESEYKESIIAGLGQFLKYHIENKKEEWKDFLVYRDGKNMIPYDYISKNKEKVKGTSLTVADDYAPADYVINYFYSTVNSFQLFIGDPAFFHKSKQSKNVIARMKEEGKTEAQINVAKTDRNRLLSNYKEEDFYQEINDTYDNIGKRLSANNSPRQAFNQEQTALATKHGFSTTHFRQAFATSLERGVDDKLRDKLYANFEKHFGKKQADELISSYEELDKTDAQEWITEEEFTYNEWMTGSISDEQFDSIMTKLRNNESIDWNAEGMRINAQKPVFTGFLEQDKSLDTSVRSPLFIKSAAMVLTKQMTNGTQLEEVRKYMVENGIQRLAFHSAVKVGMPPAQKFWDEDGNIDFEDITNLSLRREHMGIQQKMPFKKKALIKMGTQVKKLLFNNIRKLKFNLKNITGEDKVISGEELEKLMINKYSDLLADKLSKLEEQIGLVVDENFQVVSGPDLSKLSEILKQEGLARKYPPSYIEAIGIKDGDFNIPFDLSPAYQLYQSVLLSIIEKRVNTIKLPGFAGALVSEEGRRRVRELEDIDTGQVVWVGEPKGKLGYEVDGFAEVIIPSKFVDSKGKKINLMALTTIDGEGRRVIDMEKVPDGLLEMFGFRIPSQSHSSMSALKVVGFLPDGHDNTIVAPAEFVAQMGSDFDIDKLQIYMKNLAITHRKQLTEPLIKAIKEEMDDLYNSIDPEMQKELNEAKENLVEVTPKTIIDMIKRRAYDVQHYEHGLKTPLDNLKDDITNILKEENAIERINQAGFRKRHIDKKNKTSKDSLAEMYPDKLEAADLIKTAIQLINEYNKESLAKFDEITQIHKQLKALKGEKAREYKSLKDIEYGVEIATRENVDDESLVLENELIDIHIGVISSPNTLVRALVTSPLEYGKLYHSNPDKNDKLAVTKMVKETAAKRDRYWSPASDSYQRFKYLQGQAGKDGIGVFSSFSMLQALGQNKRLNVFNGEGSVISPTIGNIRGNDTLFELRTRTNKNRFLSDVVSSFQSTSVDNEKLQLMGALNVNHSTFGYVNLMIAHGFQEEEIVSVLLQPTVVEFARLQGLDDSNPEKNLVKVMWKMWEEQGSPQTFSYTENVNGRNVTKTEDHPFSQYSSAEEAFTGWFKKKELNKMTFAWQGRSLTDIQSTIFMENPASKYAIMNEALIHFYQINKASVPLVQLASAISIDSQGIGATGPQLVNKTNNFSANTALELEVAEDSFGIGVQTPEGNPPATARTLFNGIAGLHGLVANVARSAFGSLLGTENAIFQTKFVFDAEKGSEETLLSFIKRSTNIPREELSNKIMGAWRSFVYSHPSNPFIKTNSIRERRRLMTNFDGPSLAERLNALKSLQNGKAYHLFISQIHANRLNRLDGQGLTNVWKLSFSRSSSDPMIDRKLEYSFLSLVEENLEFMEGYTTRDLAFDLTTYAMLNGNGSLPYEYLKFIPNSYLEETGFNEFLRDFSRTEFDEETELLNIVDFGWQFIRNNTSIFTTKENASIRRGDFDGNRYSVSINGNTFMSKGDRGYSEYDWGGKFFEDHSLSGLIPDTVTKGKAVKSLLQGVMDRVENPAYKALLKNLKPFIKVDELVLTNEQGTMAYWNEREKKLVVNQLLVANPENIIKSKKDGNIRPMMQIFMEEMGINDIDITTVSGFKEVHSQLRDRILIEELIHAATISSLKNPETAAQKAAVRRLSQFRQGLIKRSGKDYTDWYGLYSDSSTRHLALKDEKASIFYPLVNDAEMVSAFFTEPRFREHISRMPYDRESSILAVLKKVIMDIIEAFGISTDNITQARVLTDIIETLGTTKSVPRAEDTNIDIVETRYNYTPNTEIENELDKIVSCEL